MTRADHYNRKAEAERRILTALAVGMLGLGLAAWGYIAVQILMMWRW